MQVFILLNFFFRNTSLSNNWYLSLFPFIFLSAYSPLPLFAATVTFFTECIGVSIAAFLYLLEAKACEYSILTMMGSSPYSLNSTPTYPLPQFGVHTNKGFLVHCPSGSSQTCTLILSHHASCLADPASWRVMLVFLAKDLWIPLWTPLPLFFISFWSEQSTFFWILLPVPWLKQNQCATVPISMLNKHLSPELQTCLYNYLLGSSPWTSWNSV